MSRNISVKDGLLDVSFYRDFYDIKGSEAEICEHYNTVGFSKKLLPNLNKYAELLSHVLCFNQNVYVANVAHDFYKGTIKDGNRTDDLVYFLRHFYGNITASEQSGGQLTTSSLPRFINGNELVKENSKWDKLYSEIYSQFKFDPNFYIFFYKLGNEVDPFQEWLTNGIFVGNHPNHLSFEQNVNCINKISAYLNNKGIDLNYIIKLYGNTIKTQKICEDKLSKLSDVEKPLLLFFNVCRKYHCFWNEDERVEYIKKHQLAFQSVVTKLKSGKIYTDEELKKFELTFEKNMTMSVKSFIPFKVELQKFNIDTLDKQYGLIKRITNKSFINVFNKIHNLEEQTEEKRLSELLLLLIDNIVKIVEITDLNTMSLKSFVLSFFYNANLDKKKSMSKEEFIEKNRTMSFNLLKRLFNRKKIVVDDNVLLNDLKHLIEQKQFIKFTRIATQVLSLVL